MFACFSNPRPQLSSIASRFDVGTGSAFWVELGGTAVRPEVGLSLGPDFWVKSFWLLIIGSGFRVLDFGLRVYRILHRRRIGFLEARRFSILPGFSYRHPECLHLEQLYGIRRLGFSAAWVLIHRA